MTKRSKSRGGRNPQDMPDQLEANMQQTELGRSLLEHKRVWAILAFLGLGLAIGIPLYKGQTKKTREAEREIYVGFATVEHKEFMDKKIELVDYHKKLLAALQESDAIQNFLGILPDVYQRYREQKNFSELMEVYALVVSKISKTSLAYYLAGSQYAVVLEDNEKYQEAIQLLEGLVSSTFKVEDKLYLDIARLYKKLGNTEKAKTHFNYVVDKFPDTEFGKMAKLYLREL